MSEETVNQQYEVGKYWSGILGQARGHNNDSHDNF